MPWEIKRVGSCPGSKPFAVVKKGETKPRGCHETREAAQAQMRALYAAESKELGIGVDSPGASLDVKEVGEAFADGLRDGLSAEKCYSEIVSTPYGAVSFAEVEDTFHTVEIHDRIQRLNHIFQQLIGNVLYSGEVEDKAAAINRLVDEYTERVQAVPDSTPKRGLFKAIRDWFREEEDPYELTDKARSGPAMKREANLDFPARDYAYVPDQQRPATWRLRLTESPGKVTLRALAKAASALSTGQNGIPKEALSSVKRRIRQEYRKLGVTEKDIPPTIKIDDPEPRIDRRKGSGFIVFKDLLGATRWFSVYSNNYRDDDNPPEIITAASQRVFVKAVDKGIFPMPELWLWHEDVAVGDADWLDFTDDGLALASGTFRPGFEHVAKALGDYPEPLAVSHGMPVDYLVRDNQDPSIIWFHVTKEISPLPAWAAANKLTGFVVLKESTDMPISDNKQGFLRNVLGDELFDELNSSVTGLGAKAQEEGRESKEKTEDPPAETPAYVTAEDVSHVLGELVQSVAKGLSQISERLGALEAHVKELQVADQEKVAKAAASTPRASLAELISSQLTKDAQVSADSPLATAAPKETPAPNPNSTGISLIDQLIANSRNRGG